MSKAPGMLLTTMWQEVGQPVKEESSAQVASILRMDSEALILETNVQSSIFMGLGMFVMCLTVFFVPLIGYAMWPVFEPQFWDLDTPLICIVIFLVISGMGLFILGLWFINLGLIRPAPSPQPHHFQP